MVGSDVLLAVAEVSVAFAGFSSIVAAFLRRSAREWLPLDLARLWQMISYSLLALLLALFPFVMAYTGIAEATLWTIASAAMAITIAVQYSVATALALRSLGGDRSDLSAHFTRFVLFGSVLSVVIQALNCFGVLFERAFTAYFIGLLWLVSASAIFFIRLVMSGFREEP